MKKTKTQKGITLVALIITIIVLLILAVVAITAINNDGIFSHANNAATKFNDAQGNEQNDLNTYESLLNQYGGGSTTVTPGGGETPVEKPTQWTLDRTTLKVQKEGYEDLTVGDYVNYVSGVEGYTDTNGWRVLGAANDQILLVSNVVTGKFTENTYNYNYDADGIFAAMNDFAANYGNGSYASSTGARAMKVEDINNITGFVPSTNNHTYNAVTYFDPSTTVHSFIFGSDYDLASWGDCYEEFQEAYDQDMTFWKFLYVSSSSQGRIGEYSGQMGPDIQYKFESEENMSIRVVVPLETNITLTPNGANSWTLGTAE